MGRVTLEGQFSDTYQAKRQSLVKPLLRYNAVLFSALPLKGKCFHLSLRVIIFITTFSIFYPLFSLMALIGLPFTKKVTLVLPSPKKGAPFGSPIVSASTSPRSVSGDISSCSYLFNSSPSGSDSSALAQKRVYTAEEWQVKFKNCSQHALDALKSALKFDYCRQFCCLFKLTVGSNEMMCSDTLLLRPTPSAGRLIKEDCNSRIQDISDVLQTLNASVMCEKIPPVFSAVVLIEKEDRGYLKWDFVFRMLNCKDPESNSTQKDVQIIEELEFESLKKEFTGSSMLVMDDNGFLKKLM